MGNGKRDRLDYEVLRQGRQFEETRAVDEHPATNNPKQDSLDPKGELGQKAGRTGHTAKDVVEENGGTRGLP